MKPLFKIKERGSNVRTEIIAGVTTFMAMSYILMVNPGMFSDLCTVSFNAIYIATAISAVVGTLLIGLIADLPLAQASGMSLNAFFGEFKDQAFLKVFTEGFDFSSYLASHSMTSLIITFATTALAFCMVDMFDTMGTLYGARRGGNMLVENKDGDLEVPSMNQAMLADAIATCTGAVCGTSTVTTYVESSAGVAVGGLTGLSAIVTAILFAVAMFLSPIAAMIPACAYAAALIHVGILMMGCVKDIQWDNPSVSVPSFLTLAMMPFTYNISYGIAFGLLSHVVIKLCTGKIKDLKIGTWVITILFVAMFFLTH